MVMARMKSTQQLLSFTFLTLYIFYFQQPKSCCEAFMVGGQMLLHHRPSSSSLSSNKNHHVKMSSSSSDGDFGALKIKEGTIQVPRDDDDYTLHYTLVRPMSLSSRQAAPMVVLHGGPSVPANYLYPLAKHIPYRSILFYDQLGCGKSDEPTDISCYSIQKAVQDLELLLKKLSVRRFHLYGQSFGGILAFEYLKKKYADDNDDANDVECLSVILSSAPNNVVQVEQEALRLIDALESPDLFQSTHQCRTKDGKLPQPLVDAYASAGTVWRGTKAVEEYVAKAPPSSSSKKTPSVLVLRGEHDFVTHACVKDWKDLFNTSRSVREKEIPGCSHHGLLENGPLYGDIIDSFFGEYD